MMNGLLTWKRVIFSGVWGYIVLVLCNPAHLGDEAILILGIPALGLPWVFLYLYDRDRLKEPINVGAAFVFLVVGALVSTLCAIPLVMIEHLFK